MDFANEGHDLKTYFILLIITDGNIHDMKETKELIVQASKKPCSIIIVGVGNADFDQMVDLDSDETMLKDYRNNFAKRDIVQFVRYRQAVARGNLAEELLKEIPDQVCRYMEMVGYKPEPIESDMTRIEDSVKKQLELIVKKKAKENSDVNTDAKDVIDKEALYAAEMEGDDLREERPAKKVKRDTAKEVKKEHKRESRKETKKIPSLEQSDNSMTNS